MSNNRKIRPTRPKMCRQCARGNHTGHAHAVCPECGGRLERDAWHQEIRPGQWVCLHRIIAGAN